MAISRYTPASDAILYYSYISLGSEVIPNPVRLVQYDDRLPILALKIIDNDGYGPVDSISQYDSISIRLGKNDGTFVYNPTLGYDVLAEETYIYFTITAQMTTVSGKSKATVEFVKDNKIAQALPLVFHVDLNPIQEGMIESTSEYITFHQYTEAAIQHQTELMNSSKSYSDSANAASERASASEANSKRYMENSQTYSQESKTYSENSKGYAESSRLSELNAKKSEDNAKLSEDRAKSSETNSKESETNAATSETNAGTYEENAKRYYEQARDIADELQGSISPRGTVDFADLPALSEVKQGWMYNIRDAFTTTDDFMEGPGIECPPGSNVYKTASSKWDIMGGDSSQLYEYTQLAKGYSENADEKARQAAISAGDAQTYAQRANTSSATASSSASKASSNAESARMSAAKAKTSEDNAKASETAAKEAYDSLESMREKVDEAERVGALKKEVIPYESIESFPVEGELGRIYIDESSNKTYIWNGSEYVLTSGSGEGSIGDIDYEVWKDLPSEAQEALGDVVIANYPSSGGGSVPDNIVLKGGEFEQTEGIPRDADLLQGHDAEYFGTKSDINQLKQSLDNKSIRTTSANVDISNMQANTTKTADINISSFGFVNTPTVFLSNVRGDIHVTIERVNNNNLSVIVRALQNVASDRSVNIYVLLIGEIS